MKRKVILTNLEAFDLTTSLVTCPRTRELMYGCMVGFFSPASLLEESKLLTAIDRYDGFGA